MGIPLTIPNMKSFKSQFPIRLPKAVFACASVALLCFACHKDDDVEPAAIVGHWQGTQATIQVLLDGTALPYEETDDNFEPVVEFKTNGTVLLEQDGRTNSGTYTINGNTLTTSALYFETSFIELSGTYTVHEASKTTLVLLTEKEDTATDPDTGVKITRKVKATLRFRKIMG